MVQKSMRGSHLPHERSSAYKVADSYSYRLPLPEMLRVFTFALLLSLFALAVLSQDTSLREVKQAFDNANIPEDIALPFDPRFILEVSLPQTSGSAIVLKAGVQLPRNATVGPPSFTLVGLDARDGPFNPTNAQVRHFLGGNFEPSRLSRGRAILTNTTAAVSNWRQPTPTAGSDAHRYVFLVFNQPRGFNSQTLVNATTPIITESFMLVAPDPA
ncbi:PEBP-like protein [Armillaria novae-zelandiae]|uniref:PEBP-like protein n=1 Tax=Armillaria novae-zelandiae TaxID=153914 RepID=A0AA39PP11_9AGAR|nr:PEBP-like protein [Armillaria novae-zelandiae]